MPESVQETARGPLWPESRAVDETRLERLARARPHRAFRVGLLSRRSSFKQKVINSLNGGQDPEGTSPLVSRLLQSMVGVVVSLQWRDREKQQVDPGLSDGLQVREKERSGLTPWLLA